MNISDILKKAVTTTVRSESEVFVDVSVAIALLGSVGRQRRLNTGHVKRIASDMSADRFRPRDPIFFYEDDGTLADGQHRLHAVVASKTAWTFRVSLISREDAAYLDVGRLPRSEGAGHRIATGVCLHNSVIAAIKFESRNFTVHDTRSKAAVVELLLTCPDAQARALTGLVRASAVCSLPSGVLAVALRLLNQRQDGVCEWFASVRDNEPIDVAAKQLHDWLQKNRGKHQGTDFMRLCAVAAAKAWKLRGRDAALRVSDSDVVATILPAHASARADTHRHASRGVAEP